MDDNPWKADQKGKLMQDIMLKDVRKKIRVLKKNKNLDIGTKRLLEALEQERKCLKCSKTCCPENPNVYHYQYERNGKQRVYYQWCVTCSPKTGLSMKFKVNDMGGLVCVGCKNRKEKKED